LEPGRSLVARAGVAVYRVGAIKRRGKKVWILTDGGMTDNPRHAMYGARYSCLAVSNPGRENKEKVSIAGPYCESGDVIIEDLPMPKLEIGELIAIPASGAYHLSMSSNYNGSRKPAVLLLDEGQARLIQRRETIEDLLRRDRGFYLFPKKSKDDKGMENRLQLLEVTTSAFQELLSPIIGLTSSYEILKGKTSPDIEWNIFVIGEFGEKLKREVENIYHDIQNEFDLRSPSKTASRIRQLASTWKKQLLTLSVAIRQIQELRELGHRLDDPELDAILGESLINAFTQLEEVLDHLETIEGPDLTSWRPA
jgi:hypothetical protein